MKNKISLIIFLGLSPRLFDQSIFEYNESGLKPNYVVENIDSLSQKELYNKTINWIKETFKNPNDVIKTTIDNEKVRIEGYQPNLFTWSRLMVNYDVGLFYTVEISFKDYKYKFEPIEIKSEFQPKGCYEPAVGYYITISLDNGTQLYKKNGKLKCSNTLPQSFSKFINSLNANLKDFLINSTKVSEENW